MKLYILGVILFYVLIQVDGQCSPTSEFTCKEKCIPKVWRCDGGSDCKGGEDEENCDEGEPGKCAEEDFRCASDGTCIAKRWHCDGDQDCQDGSDENATECSQKHCSDAQFLCPESGQCLPLAWRCDGQNDCINGEDEKDCRKAVTCSDNEFSCANSKCISARWKCDGDMDCSDGSDEKGCAMVTCKPEQFACGVNSAVQCIPKTWACDGDVDCHDSSDEHNCNGTGSAHSNCHQQEFQCDDGRCIHQQWKCDGEGDCMDNSDEKGCPATTCGPKKFMCISTSTCIPVIYKCDGHTDCDDGSDETGCHEPCDSRVQFDCGSHCIQRSQVCDDSKDCMNGQDEVNCSPRANPCSENNGRCAQGCTNSRQGAALCYCNEGFELDSDGMSCKDIDECSALYTAGICSNHKCKNTNGSYICHCLDGYQYDHVGGYCRLITNVQPRLMFANRLDIRQMNLVTLDYTEVLNDTCNAIAMALDVNNNRVFWTDHAHESIHATNLTSGVSSILLNSSAVSTPDGLAYDWVHYNFYWTDTGHDSIGVVSVRGLKGAKTLLSGLDEPRAIVIDPIKTLQLYYTDWGTAPCIGAVGLDGSNHHKIFTGEEVAWPNGLTLDLLLDRLYWVDAKLHTIGSVLTNGNDFRHIPTHLGDLNHPFAITLFEDSLYWTDWATDAIYKGNKFNATGAVLMAAGLHSPMDIHVFHPSRQPPGVDKCGVNNGGCSHLCLPTKAVNNYICTCPDGHNLGQDRKTCEQPPQPIENSSSTTKIVTKIVTETTSIANTATTITASASNIKIINVATSTTSEDKEISNSVTQGPSGRIMGAVVGVLIAAFLLVGLVFFIIYRKYSRRTARSMNFDNPVYKKTTDAEDKVSLSRQDSFYNDTPPTYVDA